MQRERDDRNMKIGQFWGRAFLARHNFKAKLYLSELYWIVIMCFLILSALLDRRTQDLGPYPYIQVDQKEGAELREYDMIKHELRVKSLKALVEIQKCEFKSTSYEQESVFQLPSPCMHLHTFWMTFTPLPELRTYLMDGLFLN